ncbi:unnamed protein product [Soboliphyme baturini]|uniref:CUB domain-containing protein n=1 Tax=Soboliphyme baturini TaxID=241478 RepID=A0A183J3N5_9BILA|nr:unnamed protein product [Soboliphyme baturini]
MRCLYRLIGETGQRIHLVFKDFDLYFGGLHCPYDSLTVYDGDSNQATIITKVCGIQQNLEIFSMKENLYIEFTSVDLTQNEHRGFHIEYTFSRHFVDIDSYIGNQVGVSHLPGSECDLRVQSVKESEHVIKSPNFPNSYSSAMCTYIIDGFQGAQDLEKVLLHIEAFSVTSYEEKYACLKLYIFCKDAYMAIFSSGQDYTNDTPDMKFCSTNQQSIPHIIESNDARLVIVLQTSNNSKDQGFKALVKFETDFGILGTPVGDTNECAFSFNSNAVKQGVFNSPRYPENYPVETVCTYMLNGQTDERVRIVFDQFVLASDQSCADRVELYSIFPDNHETLLGKYCSGTYPGPILSPQQVNRVKVVFVSNELLTDTGFKALYQFISEKTVQRIGKKNDCVHQIIGSVSGWFMSPNFPHRYEANLACFWKIQVRAGYRILLQAVEQNNESSVFGKEFCGEKALHNAREYVSEKNVLYVR